MWKASFFNRRNTAPLGIISSPSAEALPAPVFRDALAPFFRWRKTGSSGPFPQGWKHLGSQGSSLTDKYFKVWASFRKHICRSKGWAPNTVDLISEASFPLCCDVWCSGMSMSPKWWAWPVMLAGGSSLWRVPYPWHGARQHSGERGCSKAMGLYLHRYDAGSSNSPENFSSSTGF